jgi:hypothetical protein
MSLDWEPNYKLTAKDRKEFAQFPLRSFALFAVIFLAK